MYALINAMAAVTPASADRFPLTDVSGSTAGFVTFANLLAAFGFSNGLLSVSSGGTGANNATTARTNLGITLANLGAAAATHTHNASDITAGILAMARMPFKVDSGQTTIIGVAWSSVNYSTQFTFTPRVVVSYAQNASSSGLNPLKTQSETSYGFQVSMAGSSGSGTRYVNWIAIGT
jgi:hypothetical protein